MHILYLHQYFVPPDGSGGTRSYEMARRFIIAGHRVTMITSSAFFPSTYNFEKQITKLEIDGINLQVLKLNYSNRLSFNKRILAFVSFTIRSLSAALSVKDVDIVFATSTPLTIALPAVFAKNRNKCPMIFEIRDLWPELPVAIGALRNPLLINLASKLEKWAYRNSDRIVALSPGMKDGIARSGYPGNLVTVVPNSCDVDLFRCPAEMGSKFLSKHPYLKDGPLITYAGTFGKINGVEYLVDIAVEFLKINPKVRFVLCGDGMQREKIYETAIRCGVLEKNLWIIPPIPKSEMPYLLAASTVAVALFVDLPQMWNNSANKFFDALAAGRPIMINYDGWQANLLRDTGAGLVVSPLDARDAALSLNNFISNSKRLATAREASTNLADNIFNRDKLFEILLGVFEAVM
jgi:glycosyltransferase involved in cell wall biosynthesis